jgi:hypothetical protein
MHVWYIRTHISHTDVSRLRMYLCMCVGVYVCGHVCVAATAAHTDVSRLHTCIYVCMCVGVCMCIACVSIYVYVCVCACVFVWQPQQLTPMLAACAHAYRVYACVYVSMYVWYTHTRTCVCVCKYVCMIHTHTHTHIYIHISKTYEHICKTFMQSALFLAHTTNMHIWTCIGHHLSWGRCTQQTCMFDICMLCIFVWYVSV